MSLELEISSETVPENLECVVTNERWQELIALLRVMLPDGFRINTGNPAPAPEDRIWRWFRDDGSGRPDGWYSYVGGAWIKKHEIDPGIIVMWEGAEADIDTFGGGEAGAITATTGPFWEKVDEMNGRIPIGPGEIHATGPVNISVNENKGEYEVELEADNFRDHKHFIAAAASVSGGSPPTSSNQMARDGGGFGQENYILQGSSTAATTGLTSNVGGDNADNEAFPILPKVRGIWFLRRTARTHYRI